MPLPIKVEEECFDERVDSLSCRLSLIHLLEKKRSMSERETRGEKRRETEAKKEKRISEENRERSKSDE